VALLAALLVAALVLRHPGLGLVLLVVFVYLNLSEVLVRHHGLPSLLQILVFPLALAAWADHEVQGRRLAVRGPLPWLLGLYLAVVLFSTTVAVETRLADEAFSETAKAMVLFFLVVWLASSLDRVRVAAWTLVLAGAFLALLGVIQVATADFGNEFGGLARVKDAHIYGRVFEPRIAGPLGDPNFFAQVLLVVVPLGLFLAWRERATWRKVLAYAATGAVLAGTVLTYSRGGALALAAVLGLCLLGRKVRLRHLAAAAALLLVLVAVFPAGFTSRLTTIQQVLPGGEDVIHPDSSFQKRRLYMAAAWRIFLDHPVAGVGAGNFGAHYEAYAGEVGTAARLWGEPDVRRYPHNLYLEVAAETGLLGLATFGLVVAACFVLVRRARRRFLAAGDAMGEGLCRAFEIALVGYLISSLFLHGHFIRYLWLLFGFIAALSLIAEQPRAEEEAAA